MIFIEGLNYFFLKASEDGTVRIDSRVNPFYSIPLKKIEKLPSLYSAPTVIERFNYDIRWNRRNFPSREIITPIPKKDTDWNFSVGGKFQEELHLDRQPRSQMIAARYLSLRDIVNPIYSEDDVLAEIEKLYFHPKEKSTLYRLVKILFAGKPSEEREIVANLFSHEKDFAIFLRDSIFKIEIIPLIHGTFLQEILSRMDERIIKHGLAKLSPPVAEVIRKSVSKNKFQNILNSPSLEPPEGESLTDLIENLIFQKFSRKIYYEMGSYTAYKVPDPKDKSKRFTTKLIDSKKFQFAHRGNHIEFLGASQTKLFFRLKDWTEVIRFDILLNPREWESYEYFRLPPDIILEIPFFPNARSVTGSFILKKNQIEEFYFSNWEFF